MSASQAEPIPAPDALDESRPTGLDATAVPPGFRPLPTMGGFVEVNGPLYLRHEGERVQVGFRVEPRHANPLGNCHGGMLATFCDMLLPLSIHHKSDQVGLRFLPTINLQVDYLAPAPLGAWVEGEAQVLRVTRTLVFAQGLVSADGVTAVRVSGIFKIGPPFSGGTAAGLSATPAARGRDT